MSIQSIMPLELQKLKEEHSGLNLIDVRTPVEFQTIHADFAHNVPLDLLDPKQFIEERPSEQNETIYVICHSGSRAEKACQKFIDSGHENVVNVAGGTKAWEKSGLPVVRGKKSISLERQVRIAAGLLVFIGTALGFTIHSYWLAVPAFVGAGLIFAGITDTCGMGIMLSKMPWNRA